MSALNLISAAEEMNGHTDSARYTPEEFQRAFTRYNANTDRIACDVIVKHTGGDNLLVQRDSRKHYGGMWEAAAGGPAVDQVTKLSGREVGERLILRHMYGEGPI